MKILAIETSCDIASVSILEDNNLILELKETKLSLDDIDIFAVDNGPRFFYWN